MRYDVASQERSENELNDEEMGADSVATMVVSGEDQSTISVDIDTNTYRAQQEKHPAKYFPVSGSALLSGARRSAIRARSAGWRQHHGAEGFPLRPGVL